MVWYLDVMIQCSRIGSNETIHEWFGLFFLSYFLYDYEYYFVCLFIINMNGQDAWSISAKYQAINLKWIFCVFVKFCPEPLHTDRLQDKTNIIPTAHLPREGVGWWELLEKLIFCSRANYLYRCKSQRHTCSGLS